MSRFRRENEEPRQSGSERPDPARGLAPHLILLDDGRGVNLWRIARLSVGHAFAPAPREVLFQDREASRTLLFGEWRLSPAPIAERSKALLGQDELARWSSWSCPLGTGETRWPPEMNRRVL